MLLSNQHKSKPENYNPKNRYPLINNPEHPVIGDKAVRTNSRYEAQLPVTTPHTRMPQTAYYANQAQTTLPPPAPTKIISSHFAHLSNIRTLAHAKGYIESARISSHRQL